ncbi:Ribose ABC transport system, ATP-binding protein RbsA [Minicystis rosea]|nr:Ribose ABC transport system, ATP-binding protein RbsA [Minicystis rosea]
MSAAPRRLTIRGAQKAFGPTIALAGVDLDLAPGEVHALLGENGAGKSTLLHILAGGQRMDAGEMTLDGAPYRPDGPGAARAAGVAMVHQELSLCPHLTVAENVLLGAEPTTRGFLRSAELTRRARAVLAQLAGPGREPLDPRALVRDLPPAAQQVVEIARALAQTSCRVLILDEPTSSLAAADVEGLFEVVRRLRGEGVTILYVSHFLEEVQEIADAYTVLRDGRSVGSGRIAGTSIESLVERMAGRAVETLYPRSARSPGDVVLEITDLAGARRPEQASLALRRGEVLGIAGLVGAGRTELLRAVFGLDPVRRGAVRVGAFTGSASPAERLAQGVGMLSEDRKGEGLALALSIADNLTLSTLARLGRGGFVSDRAQHEATRRWIDKLAVRCRDPGQPVRDLSGGNQQKVALGRLLHHDVDVLLLDEPTRGIDVGSKAQIYAVIDELAARGKAVLFVSSYLPELLGVCDRIAVMRRGHLLPPQPAAGLTEEAVLLLATGS